MATTKITFEDKVAIIPKGNRVNQVWDEDINQIKDAINKNADVQNQHAQSIANSFNSNIIYNQDFLYNGGAQTFTIVQEGIIVKNVFRGRLKLFTDEYTVNGNVVTITYDILEVGEKISITN